MAMAIQTLPPFSQISASPSLPYSPPHPSFPPSKTGSVCCVASRPRDSARHSDGWSVGPSEPFWRFNGGFSPPASVSWDYHHHHKDLRGSSCSSEASQQQRSDLPADGLPSQLDSPTSDSFRAPPWNPSSHSASIGDLVAAATGHLEEGFPKNSSPTSDREVHIVSGDNINNNFPASASFRLAKEAIPDSTKHPSSSLYRNLSGSRYLPKLGSKHIFRRQSSDSRFHTNKKNVETDETSGADRAKQLLTISQIVEASKRDEFAWSDVNSSSQLSWNMDLDDHMSISMDRIRASSFQSSGNHSTDSDSATQKCALCSRCLLRRSPWSSQRLLVSGDLPVVGVLVCGHIFHADCLEKSIPDVLRHDPPCPVCEKSENATSKAFLLKLDGMRGTMESLRNRLAKTFNARSSGGGTAKEFGMKQISMRSFSGKDRAAFPRSPSKLQFPIKGKAVKDSSSPYPGPARVSPDQT